MARLNEPPVLGDSIEALKRRFIRQNREIARANSIQSTKIRTLEIEASRLLSENIALREENIRLQNALDESHRHGSVPNITAFKEKFQSKVHELNSLLLELTETTEAKEPRRLHRKSHCQSLYQRQRPTTEELTEIALAEGRLAPIVEDKPSPSKSWYTDEIRISIPDISNISDSPEFAPPTMPHFEEGDPIKRSGSEKRPSTESPSKKATTQRNSGSDTGLLSSNLETRRHRRESAPTKDTGLEENREVEKKPTSTAKTVESASAQSLKTGTKRKFAAKEEDSKPLVKSSSQHDLASARKRDFDDLSSRAMSRSKSHVNLSSIASSMNKSHAKPNNTQQSRRALGEKSVNTDPVVSPAKPRPAGREKPSTQEKDEPSKLQDRAAAKEKPIIRQIRPIKYHEESVPTVEVRVPPKTPAPMDDDVFSPSSRPSTARAESRDTPPPGDLQSSGDNAARPSRRQRAAVSYAEPNLRDKMRRPGKEMVDAVTGMRKSRMSMSDLNTKEDGPSTSDLVLPPLSDEAPHTHKTKEPTSPLTGKSTATNSDPSTLPPNTLSDRHRRATTLHRRTSSAAEAASEAPRASASQETIAALISSSNKKLSRVRDPAFETSNRSTTGSGKDVSTLTESLSVFDLHLSSPPNSSSILADDASSKPARAAISRANKRHSSVADLRGVARGDREDSRKRGVAEMEADLEAEVETKATESRRAERAERRRSMMV